jgi:hypothetical protein
MILYCNGLRVNGALLPDVFFNLHAEESADSIATSQRESLFFYLKSVVKTKADIERTFDDIGGLVDIIQ